MKLLKQTFCKHSFVRFKCEGHGWLMYKNICQKCGFKTPEEIIKRPSPCTLVWEIDDEPQIYQKPGTKKIEVNL